MRARAIGAWAFVAALGAGPRALAEGPPDAKDPTGVTDPTGPTGVTGVAPEASPSEPSVPALAKSRKPNAITLEPLAVVFARTITLEYERAFGAWMSVFIQPSLILGSSHAVVGSGDTATSVDGDYFAVAGTLGVRIFPWRGAPGGPFVSPFAGVAYTHATAGSDSASGIGWSVGGMIGYTFVLGSVFDLSIGGGAAYVALDIDAGGKRFGETGVQPSFRVAVGAVF